MPQYTVKHQCDRTCANCDYYSFDIFQDSFGPYSEEYCEKGQYGHVSRYAEPCKYYKNCLDVVKEA